MNVKKTVVCKSCGNKFDYYYHSHPNRIYCSRECFYKSYPGRKLNKKKSNIIDGNIAKIDLGHGRYATIDLSDYENVNKYNWSFVSGRNNRSTNYAHGYCNGKWYTLHKFLMNTPVGMMVDHIDGNGLNNRRNNLRICNSNQNSWNSKRQYNGSTKYKGVQYWKRDKNYKASIGNNGKTIHIGYYSCPEDAAKAYDRKAKELFGEFAKLNFPENV